MSPQPDDARREYMREYLREWRRKNPEKSRSYGREWRARNREQVAAKNRRWAAENPDKIRRYSREGARRRREAEGYSPESREYVAILEGDPCCFCGSREQMEIDHIVPLIGGGDGLPDNLTATCRTCNRQKNSRPLLMFLLGECYPRDMRRAA